MRLINSDKLGTLPFFLLIISENGSDLVCSKKSSATSITKTELGSIIFCSSFEKLPAMPKRIKKPNKLKMNKANKEAKKVLKKIFM